MFKNISWIELYVNLFCFFYTQYNECVFSRKKNSCNWINPPFNTRVCPFYTFRRLVRLWEWTVLRLPHLEASGRGLLISGAIAKRKKEKLFLVISDERSVQSGGCSSGGQTCRCLPDRTLPSKMSALPFYSSTVCPFCWISRWRCVQIPWKCHSPNGWDNFSKFNLHTFHLLDKVFNENKIFVQIAGEDRSPSVCGLCYDRCRDASCPPCGHLFCWNCINRWMHIRSQCPMCRQHLNSPADIIPLVNYKWIESYVTEPLNEWQI